MDYLLRQGGRAASAFLSDLSFDAGALLRPLVNADVASRAMALISEWCGSNHGRIARTAFEEMRPELQPKLDALQSGPTTLVAYPERPIPEYFSTQPWIHRTTGGWDGHDYQGFVHGELVHRTYVSRNYGGNIYGERRAILAELSQREPRRILEIGTSSGNFTLQLQHEFQDAEIWGCDLSIRMLEEAQRVGNEQGYAWNLHQLPGEDTGFESASFDLVASYIVVHEVPAAITARHLNEAFRLLRPGGEVLFSDAPRYSALDKAAVRWADYVGVHGGEPFWRDAAQHDLGASARAAGFVDVRSQARGAGVYPWYVYGRKP